MLKKSNSIISSNPETLRSLENLGQRIRANRISQGWTVKQMAERLLCSQNTYRSIESGNPTSSIGIIVNVLWLFGQIDSIDSLVSVPISTVLASRVRKSSKNSQPGFITEDERDF